MDAFHERLARVGLAALAEHGFALAGGYAVQVHGLVDRLSEDVDLFTTIESQDSFSAAVRDAVTAYTADGLTARVILENPGFARLTVTEPASGRSSKVELGIDWRRDPPAQSGIGPVLARDDAVANKVGALYSRAQARDFIDVDAALAQAYQRDQLLVLAAEHDRGFVAGRFAEALRAVRRLPIAEFTAYGLSEDQAEALVRRSLAWADEIDDQG